MTKLQTYRYNYVSLTSFGAWFLGLHSNTITLSNDIGAWNFLRNLNPSLLFEVHNYIGIK